MRFYSFFLISLLVAATIINAEEDDLTVHEDDDYHEPVVTKTTTRRLRKTTSTTTTTTTTEAPIEEYPLDENYPHCHAETIDGYPGYICEHTVDGEIKQFAFRTGENNMLQCGDFVDGKINGAGYAAFYAENGYPSHQCGDFTDGQIHGSGSYQFFGTQDLEIGHFANGFRDGVMLNYDIQSRYVSRALNKEGTCRSIIWYNEQGNEHRRDMYSCAEKQADS